MSIENDEAVKRVYQHLLHKFEVAESQARLLVHPLVSECFMEDRPIFDEARTTQIKSMLMSRAIQAVSAASVEVIVQRAIESLDSRLAR